MHKNFVLFLQVLFLFMNPVSTRVISGNGFEIQAHEEPLRRSPAWANDRRRSMTRRASTSMLQPPNTNPQPDGWISYYTPILPFDSTDKSAADLRRFYDLLQTEVNAVIAENYVRGSELELVDNQIRLEVRCFDHNNFELVQIPDYRVVLDFLAYIVSFLPH